MALAWQIPLSGKQFELPDPAVQQERQMRLQMLQQERDLQERQFGFNQQKYQAEQEAAQQTQRDAADERALQMDALSIYNRPDDLALQDGIRNKWGAHQKYGPVVGQVLDQFRGASPDQVREYMGRILRQWGSKAVPEPKEVDPVAMMNRDVIPDGKGGYMVNPYKQQAALERQRAGKTELSVGGPQITLKGTDQARSAGVKKIFEKSAEDQVERFKNIFNAAEAGVENAAKTSETLNLLRTGSAYTGIGAELKKDFDRVAYFFTKDKEAGKRIADTELLNALMGSDVFPMIKALGIGARGLDTPAERQFLREVMTGVIDMNKDSLIRLTMLRNNIAIRAVRRWNKMIQEKKFNPLILEARGIDPNHTFDLAGMAQQYHTMEEAKRSAYDGRIEKGESVYINGKKHIWQ